MAWCDGPRVMSVCFCCPKEESRNSENVIFDKRLTNFFFVITHTYQLWDWPKQYQNSISVLIFVGLIAKLLTVCNHKIMFFASSEKLLSPIYGFLPLGASMFIRPKITFRVSCLWWEMIGRNYNYIRNDCRSSLYIYFLELEEICNMLIGDVHHSSFNYFLNIFIVSSRCFPSKSQSAICFVFHNK